MSEMVERVARAIWEKRRKMAALVSIELEEWGDGTIPRANHVFEEAIAAIKAMRGPTKAMKSAPTWYDGNQSFTPGDAEAVWDEMIDAALADKTA